MTESHKVAIHYQHDDGREHLSRDLCQSFLSPSHCFQSQRHPHDQQSSSMFVPSVKLALPHTFFCLLPLTGKLDGYMGRNFSQECRVTVTLSEVTHYVPSTTDAVVVW